VSDEATEVPAILHLHSTFAAGGKELRCVRLINAFGHHARHSVVSAMPGRLEASELISPNVAVNYPTKFPSLRGRPTPGRLQKIAKAMQQYDLVLTYNWGAMDAAMAHTMFSGSMDLPPLIHHEDGFNEDERKRLKWSRNFYRRIALGKAQGLVVPSEKLEEIALETWQQPIGRVKRIPNGIQTRAFAPRPKIDAIPGFPKHDDTLWVGTLAGLREVKNLPRLVQAFAKLPAEWRLVIVGEGPEKDAIRNEASRLKLSDRVFLPGFVADPSRYVGLFDIFALSSDTEQFPISVLEAMAASLPVVAPAVGDIADMVSEENAPLIVAPGDTEALGDALLELADNADLAGKIGEANRVRALAEFDEKAMIDSYRRLYWSAMGFPAPKLFGEFSV